jgi:hypothetical protein
MIEHASSTPTPARRWYREPWPWIIMIAPAVSVLAGVMMLWLAITSYDGLVSDDYYKQGLAINQVLRRDERAAELGYHAHASLSEDSSRVRVLLLGAQSSSLPATLTLRLAHPTRAGGDQTAVLRAGSPGRYEARLIPPETGRWRVSIEDVSGTWRLAGNWRLPHQRAIELEAVRQRP